jgi:hypothetical protein
MRYYLGIMAYHRRGVSKEVLKVSSVKLSTAAERILQTLSQDASDQIGWTVTSSAVMRALIRYAEKQLAPWATNELFPLIEEEIAQGRVWGSKKKNKL